MIVLLNIEVEGMQDNIVKNMSEEFAEYLRDESRTIGCADSISFPICEKEITDIVKNCYANSIKITVQGGRTGLAAAAVPFGGHIMNLSKMNKIVGINKEGNFFYLNVQPGLVLSELRKAIASKKFDISGWTQKSLDAYAEFIKAGEQFFPPDPTETSATLGGMVSCNASGARTHGYGATRRYIVGLRMVLADGDTVTIRRGEVFADKRQLKITTDSGRVIDIKLPTYEMPDTKNASGYYAADNMDAIDIFIGSDGTLGIISEIKLQLLPMPAEVWGTTCFFETEEQAVVFTDKIKNTDIKPVSLEYFDARALEILRVQKTEKTAFAALPKIPDNAGTAVYVELHCDDENTAAQKLFEVGGVIKEAGGDESNTWVARTETDRDRLLFFRHAVPESVNMLIDERKKKFPNITKLGSDMSVPDKNLFDVVELYRKTLAENGLEAAAWGHIGENHLHVNILPRNDEEYNIGKKLFVQWAGEVTKMGGAVSAEHGVGKLKASFLKVMYGEEHIKEMAELKKTFDEKYILGVGNLFTEEDGGIER